MPEVAGKKFPYTKQGVKTAEKVAKKTGAKVLMKKKFMPSSDGKYLGKQINNSNEIANLGWLFRLVEGIFSDFHLDYRK